MESDSKPYAVWRDEEFGYNYGTIEQAGNKEIVMYCDNYEEARIAWKQYYYNP